MKILYVFRSLAVWGGIERILIDKMNSLASQYGHEVWMLTADQGQHPIPYYIYSGVRVEDLDIRLHQRFHYRGLRRIYESWRLKRLFCRRLKERIAEIAPDRIVCVATSYAYLVSRVAGDIPLIIESHSICRYTLHSQGFRQLFEVWQLRRRLHKARVIVALTEGDAREWRRYHPNVRVIPNMVHLAENLQPNLAEAHRVIFVGRFDYQKRASEALCIWGLVQQRFPDWHLDVYGEGEELKQLEAMISQTDMNVKIHQPTDRIFDCYRESSILISTSLFEPFGLVLVEAMSSGLPVVAYDCPYGPSQIITDGQDGFLVTLDDRTAFADKLCRLMADASLRKQMGQAAAISAQRFSEARIMPLWCDLLDLKE